MDKDVEKEEIRKRAELTEKVNIGLVKTETILKPEEERKMIESTAPS